MSRIEEFIKIKYPWAKQKCDLFQLLNNKNKSYVILNVQKKIDPANNQIKYFYKPVGSWNTDTQLQLDLDQIVYPNQNKILTSVCSEQCTFGHVKV